MDTTLLFTAALQLPDSWRVSGVEFRDGEGGRRELHIAIGFDETSRKGHRYITVVADLAERNVICVVPGKDANTVKRFALDFMDHNGDPNRVTLVTCDMSLGFAKGICEHLPNAAKVIDKFHVIKHANEAVDKVRKTEAGRNPLLRRTKYLWLRNEEGLTGL